MVGIVHLRDLIGHQGTVGDLMETPTVFPKTVRVLDALREMQHTRHHLAVVVGEHGTGEGIVTIEDLLEELVGEIYDESDKDVAGVERTKDEGLEMSGSFPIHDLVDLGVDFPPGDYTTVAGLVLAELGRLPHDPGDRIVVNRWEVTVLAVEERAITRVRIQPRQTHDDGRALRDV